jgi:hypothetical protein
MRHEFELTTHNNELLRTMKPENYWRTALCTLALAGLVLAGCQSNNAPPAGNQPQATSQAPPAKSLPTIRIKAGASAPLTDPEGNVWLPDQGYVDGDVSVRPDLKIENTKNPALYLTERYSMSAFNYPVPNGKYLVKLHFAETYEGITGPGQRVFSVNVQGTEIKDLDVWAKAGGPLRPWVDSIPVEITDGKLHITFTANVENPEINAIEIIPQP